MRLRKSFFVSILAAFMVLVILSGCAQPSLVPSSEKITAEIHLTLNFPFTKAFQDELPISKFQVRVLNSSGTVIYSGEFTSSEISITVQTYPGVHTIEVEAYTDNSELYDKETKIMEGSSQVNLRDGANDVFIALEFLSGQFSLNMSLNPDAPYIIESSEIQMVHSANNSELNLDHTVNSTEDTYTISDLEPGVWHIVYSATLTNINDNTVTNLQEEFDVTIYPARMSEINFSVGDDLVLTNPQITITASLPYLPPVSNLTASLENEEIVLSWDYNIENAVFMVHKKYVSENFWRYVGETTEKFFSIPLVQGDEEIAMVGVNAVANGMESGITYVGPAYIVDFEYGIPVDWILGGDALPFVQDSVFYEGNHSLQFGDIDNYEKSWVEFTVNYNVPVILSFWVKVSSEEDFDYFRFYVDNVLWDELSGEVDWTPLAYLLPPGEHTIRFAYKKDSSVSEGYDTAWVDYIIIQPEEQISTTSAQIIADNETHVVGRIGYIDVQVVDESGVPIPGVNVQLLYQESDGNWYPLSDAITEENSFTTDSNGIAKIRIWPVQSGTVTFKARLVGNPSIETQFDVTFQGLNWFFLVWMCADNNLESFALNDLSEMLNSNENVSVVVIFDGFFHSDWIYVLNEEGEWEGGPADAEIDSGNISELINYMEYASNLEASHRAIILWDHGNAWLYDAKARYSPRAICFDETSGNHITTPELRQALEEYNSYGLPRIDILGMDACLMGSIEVLYELRGLVDYIVASSFTEPGDGWDYSFLANITSSDDALDVGMKIVDAYRNFYDETFWENYGLSLAVYDANQVTGVTDSLNSLASRLVSIMDDSLRITINSFYPSLMQYYPDYNLLVDLNNCAISMQDINNSDVQTYANEVSQSLEQLVIYEYAEKSGTSIENPVSIFMPDDPDSLIYWGSDYNSLLFSQELLWSNFLESWHQTGDVLSYKSGATAFLGNSLKKKELKSPFLSLRRLLRDLPE
ncbi:peptidase C11 [Thermotoga maritima MSB8]|jgi:hypothetical protein|uniref:Clostripain-related protein n=2 Tax=Thermotoga TaxID=2335 RepID=Q9X1S5_THEMA|nr:MULTISPECIES: clostripain-related cysteine peptidase [Thermotoga]AAD36656.1 clostripain-related protein [Thermotoga maritima MSB8]ACB09596.1 peptidase C11 clostripain [Thermotoga sp. RQ2]ADA67304.1 peptidase C11 clostripain [Thermotoga petrophila RKU-10]AGL50521.1 hypothetical protein Tmari_1597 [Thermotoga maritima MSB8]AHD18514.1 peptidase C11 [Thermotoga maritima MSB8]